MTRQLSVATSSRDAPVMDLDVNVGAMTIGITQPQIAFIWRSAFAHVAEVKAAWSWQYGGARASKSVLEIESIRVLLDSAFEAAAEKERQRQARILYIYLCIHDQSIDRSIYLSICLSVYLSIYLSGCNI